MVLQSIDIAILGMRPTRNLYRLDYSVNKRIEKIRKCILKNIDGGIYERDSTLAFAAIEIQNCWSNFVRAYYLSCMFTTKSAKGSIVRSNTPITSIDDGINLAIRVCKPRARPTSRGTYRHRDEPTWHDTYTLLALSRAYIFSNQSDIEAALSLQSRAFIDLPVFRNFFAHRNQYTIKASRDIAVIHSIVYQRRPSDILLSRGYARPQALIFDWMDDIATTVTMLCE